MSERSEQQSPGVDPVNRPQAELEISVEELDQLLALQQEMFRLVAENRHFITIIDRACEMAQALLPNSLASVMLLDRSSGELNVISAPSVPKEGVDALCGLRPGPGGGSCGNAVYRNEPVFVTDTYTDERWQDLRQLAYDFNLCACWSMPIRDAEQRPIGSFALSSFEHRQPSSFHIRLLEVGASLISLVLAREEQAQALQRNAKRLELFATALSNSSEGVIITDPGNRILEVNAAFEAITGYRADQVIGQAPSILASGLHDRAFYDQMWRELGINGRWSGEVINRRADGSLLDQWLTVNTVRDDQGQIANYVAVFTDLSELKSEREGRIRALEHDPLSGLPNTAKLKLQLDAVAPDQALLLLNLNNFSYINTAYGVEVGDQLLQAVAQELCGLALPGELFRIDADQFAVHFTQEVDLELQILRIQQHFLSSTVNVDQLRFNLTFNFGGVSGSTDLMRRALIALKTARSLGKNRFHLYNSESDEPQPQRRLDFAHWNGWLHDALRNKGVVPWYQGVRDNFSGRIDSFEVLARLERDGVIHSPAEFIPVAQLSGVLPVLTREMIAASFARMASTDFNFSLNITSEDLDLGYLADHLDEIARVYGIKRSRVVLEIHEGVSSGATRAHLPQLRELKQRGYRLAIDDFGTEYSNFERILELDVDYIKIDARYIRHIDTDPRSYEITRAIVFFARNAGIKTVAEFVHSEAVQAVVESLGIDYSQGYLFSEPAAHPEPNDRHKVQ
ncbi:EAL domain-containing protein [Marinobacterium sp. D7]|uniref:sensor domain-containing diguanylate cyclase n=1 Tax=Marinobacterium ramblicola TaxID=2849041 RepID=UPI001C2CEFB7|nr:EAL domain-containing protein [Marinobacterium ramblicola]MBV1788730.1 EAL domain-containing protein [Marinobacterium ramblicola]